MEPWLSPLFDADGIRAVDRWAIEEQGVPGEQLMETAGTALAEAVAALAPQGPVRIVCG
jgi:NAD(P)H-hydrate repair Nnr-like enzyme with NAD(P)H-hydrate epimerase domain